MLNDSISKRMRMKYRVPTNTPRRESSAAMAAPLSPIAGIGPTPKIRIGSRMILVTDAMTISMLGKRVSPVARMLLMPTMPTTTNGTPM